MERRREGEEEGGGRERRREEGEEERGEGRRRQGGRVGRGEIVRRERRAMATGVTLNGSNESAYSMMRQPSLFVKNTKSSRFVSLFLGEGAGWNVGAREERG